MMGLCVSSVVIIGWLVFLLVWVICCWVFVEGVWLGRWNFWIVVWCMDYDCWYGWGWVVVCDWDVFVWIFCWICVNSVFLFCSSVGWDCCLLWIFVMKELVFELDWVW